MLTPFLILTIIAILCAVTSLVWQQHPLLAVAVILLAVAALIGR